MMLFLWLYARKNLRILKKNIIIFNIAEQDEQKPPAAKNEGDENQVVNIITSIVPEL